MAVPNISNHLSESFLENLMEALGNTALSELKHYYISQGITEEQFNQLYNTDLFLDAWTDQIESYIRDQHGLSL